MDFSEHNPITEGISDSADSAGGEDKHMILGSDEFSDTGDVITFEEKPRLKIKSGTMLIVIVALIAAAGLFSMRTLTRASAATSAPKEIEKSIDEFLNVVINKTSDEGADEGVLGVLSESYASRQVPLDDVQRNPFIIFEPLSVQSVPVVSGDPTAHLRQTRMAEFEKAAEDLHLGMILMGSEPLANINKRVVRVGELIPVSPEVEFEVVRIESDRVDFVARDPALDVEFEWTVTLRKD